jgi:endonuclease/exonuclease/phosphatase family metal-dependent hydrolase
LGVNLQGGDVLFKDKSRLVKASLLAPAILAFFALIFTLFTQFQYFISYQAKLTSEVFNIAEIERTEGEITVMSSNVRCFSPSDTGKRSWFYRADLLLQNIREAAPDIIGFQEVTPIHYSYFQKKLVGYDSILTYRDDSLMSEACPVFYRADAFELIDKNSFWLSETPDVMSKSWGSSCHRICSYAILKEKASGREFIVFNTHLDHVSELARINGIQVVLDRISLSSRVDRRFLMGDFNAYEDSDTYRMSIEHFADARYIAAELSRISVPSTPTVRVTPIIIDYIFVTPNVFEVEKFDGNIQGPTTALTPATTTSYVAKALNSRIKFS